MIALHDRTRSVYARTESVYAKELEHELLSEYEEYQLLRDAQSGDENAREKLLLLNLRLVRSIVQKYENPQLKVFADDLMADGVIGLHKAISNYDISFGTRLSTYAVIAIHRAVARSPLLQSAIRLPVHVRDQIRVINKAKTKLLQEGRVITSESISELSDLPLECVEKLRCLNVEKNTFRVDSLEGDVDIGDGSVQLLEMVADRSSEFAYEQVDLEITLEYFLSKLSERDRFVVERSYGIPIYMTHAEISKVVGCNKRSVGWILKKAMSRMQRLARALRGSVDDIQEALENPFTVMAGDEDISEETSEESSKGTSEKPSVVMTDDEKTIPLFAVHEDQIDISKKRCRKQREKVEGDTSSQIPLF